MKKFCMSSLRKFATPMLALMIGTTGVNHVGAATVYAFAQQKVYDLTLNTTTPLNSTLVPNPAGFNVATANAAALNGFGPSTNIPVPDALQAFIGTVPVPVENYSGQAPFGVGNLDVLLQHPLLVPGGASNSSAATIPVAIRGVANANTIGLPALGNLIPPFALTDDFARADVLTRYPNAASAPPMPANGIGINNSYLFNNPVPTSPVPSTISMSSAAEALVSSPVNDIATAISDWTISGLFNMTSLDGLGGIADLNFNLISRIVAFTDSTPSLASATNTLSFDVLNTSSGVSVFGFPGNNPTSTSFLTYVSPQSDTFNSNTAGVTDTYPGPVNFVFKTPKIADGNYTFVIKGSSSVTASVVPEPSSYVLMGLCVVTFAGLQYRRKMQLAKVRVS